MPAPYNTVGLYIDHEVFLDGDPTAPGTTYGNTYTDGLLTQETWTRTVGGKLLKSIDYTFVDERITQEVVKVWDDGVPSIVAQTTRTFTYTDNRVTGGTIVRNV